MCRGNPLQKEVTMKLAEALILRADYQKRIEQLKARILRNVLVQEGEEPAEQPAALIAESQQTYALLLDMVQRINRTNCNTAVAGHGSLADAIAERDNIRARASLLRSVAEQATVTMNRYSKAEVKFVSMLSVADIQARADALAVAYRELDAQIQGLSCWTELLD